MTLSIDTDLITIDKIQLSPKQSIETDMLRLDKIHPQISGNKWFKLKYYLEMAKQAHKTGLLTLGGPWSNHLLAVAAAAQINGLESIGIIRGEKPHTPGSTLQEISELGMQLKFINRSIYKERDALLSSLQKQHPDFLLINEGGQGEPGILGAGEILKFVQDLEKYTHILVAVGTGTMLAGLALASISNQQIVGISSLKGEERIAAGILEKFPSLQNRIKVLNQYHFGGYARHNPTLLAFMNQFYAATQIPTDFVYTGKLCYAWHELCTTDYFPKDSKILLIHSGGLQGNRSIDPDNLIF
ncbi:1-aminocyclopropane-1-carboxylate deaminase/D-cysteine desulfhydrase [Flavihumibacter sp. UBA7668]|uniref:1-aminocyclopropane-1-carboxylate deaminase/D-cysteine desulfhydrase n=1 Tax=Flavihumibacter sp. UBA7668 TaxID=1946542 RepID=UPI0025C03196|nr:pyridoxal-phosphate dependent enzyme [Flavihumibacter sp. UBA7668]